MSLLPLPARRLEGTEPVVGDQARVVDFWRWAYSDMRDNVSRGVLAEWLVGVALGCVDGVRPAWGNFDLKTSDGIRVEVKSAAYLQSWPTAKHSRIAFSRLSGLAWDDQTGEWASVPSYRADVYVFAILTTKEHSGLDPLDVDQWEFWVAGRAAVESRATRSLSLSAVKAIAQGPIGFGGLAEAVRLSIASEGET